MADLAKAVAAASATYRMASLGAARVVFLAVPRAIPHERLSPSSRVKHQLRYRRGAVALDPSRGSSEDGPRHLTKALISPGERTTPERMPAASDRPSSVSGPAGAIGSGGPAARSSHRGRLTVEDKRRSANMNWHAPARDRRVEPISCCRNGRHCPVEKRKPGRRSKGQRKPLHCQMPESLLTAAQRRAAARGMTLTDLVGELLSTETGVPYEIQATLPYQLAEELPQTA